MVEGMAAVVLSAGKGVRMVSEEAKVLHPLCGMPMLGHVLKAVEKCGPERTLVVVGHQAEAVMDRLSDWGVEFVMQEQQRGTGHALMQAEKALARFLGEVLVLPGDTPLLTPQTLEALIEEHRSRKAAVTLLTASLPDPSGYGRVIRDEEGGVARIVEDRDASPQQAAVKEINGGVYCFSSQFLFHALKEIRGDNAQGELYLTDLVEVARGRSVEVASLETDAEEVLGINSRVDLAQAGNILRGRINHQWMLQGVTIVDPVATYIDCDVRIGGDTVIHPGSNISGPTVVGKRCTIMSGTVIIDSSIGDDARLGPYCVLEGVHLPSGDRVAPFEVKRGSTHP